MPEHTVQKQLQVCLAEALRYAGDPLVMPSLERFRELYRALDDAAKLELFVYMGKQMEIRAGEGRLLKAARVLEQPLNLEEAETTQRLIDLRDCVDPPRLAVLRQFVNVTGGIKFVVDMRADLLKIMRDHRELPCLKLIDADLLHLFRSWFNFGFLQLRPINWETTSAAQLEKLMEHDVVHPMTDWRALRRRLERDRLCYAFYHPNMPEEPVIFVEIALTRTIANSIDWLFKPSNALDSIHDATTAIFYSINATQEGLSGVSLGNSLIKTVVGELRRNWPQLKRFATLSPMPGFRDRYFEAVLKGQTSKLAIAKHPLDEFFEPTDVQAIKAAAGKSDLAESLAAILASDDWTRDADLRLALKSGMLRVAHFYLTQEKRGGDPLNPVANFHLKNGACIYNVNYLSNTAPKGMAESYGMTVNYHYDLPRIEENQRLAREGHCPVSPQLEKMLQMGVSA